MFRARRAASELLRVLGVALVLIGLISIPVGALAGTTTYTYDELGRLVSTAPPIATVQYTYDAAGNRTQTVIGSSSAPVAGTVTITVNANSTGNQVPLNITGGTPTSVAVSTAASHGSAVASGASISYTPNTNYGGSDSFQYTATNAGGTSAPATVTVTVNQPPIAGAASATVAENSSNNSITLNITGGAPTSVTVSTQASHGTATASGTSISYTPTSGYSGSDAFGYTATNAIGTSTPATVSITVNPLAPVANAVNATIAANSSSNPIPLNITGSPTSVAVSTQAAHGTATASGTSIAYTPANGYSGSDSFAYTASNAGGTSSPATASITINPPAPIAGAVSQTVAYNSTATPINLSLSGGAASSVAVSTAPAHGTAAASGTAITYTPTSGYSGSDSFQYTATNVSGTSSPATAAITISPALPIANAVSQTVPYNTATPITLSLSGGAATGVAVSTAPTHGTATASGTSISYTSTSGYSGSDSFQYTASNAAGASSPATATISVLPQAPIANASSQTVAYGSTSNPVTLNITGGTPTAVSITGSASHGTATASGTSITYTPGNYVGSDSFVYTAANLGGSSYATVSITINPSPPTAGPVSAAVAANSTSNPISLNVSGVSVSSVAVTTAASHGTATASGTAITYTPTSGYSGTDSFAYTATNPGGTSSPGTVSMSVGIVAVTIGAGSYQTGGASISFPTNSATVVYGSGSYTYVWSNTNDGDGTWTTGGTSSTFAPSVSGLKALKGCGSSATYTVTVTDTVTHRTATSNGASYTATDNSGPGCSG